MFGCFWLSQAMPLAQKMIDLTYVFDETTPHHPMHKPYQMTLLHNQTFRDTAVWLQLEDMFSATHAGTHMDAPAHFKKGGITMEQIDITRFVAPAAVIDITERASQDPNAEVTVGDLLAWEATTGQTLNGSIVLMRSGWGKKWTNSTEFYGTPIHDDISELRFPGISPDAARWLIDNRNINGVGVDTLSFDRGQSDDFLSHVLLLGHGLFGLENVANMEELPIYGATLYVFPMKLGRASGAPTRIVASIPKVVYGPHSTRYSQ